MEKKATRPIGTKAARTRAAVLRVAEQVFADKGYAAVRLEDVACGVGIRRASLLYHVRDKRDLYDAVLEDVYADLAGRYGRALAGVMPPTKRIEAIVTAWVGFIGARPTAARLLLWEAAGAASARAPWAAATGGLVVAVGDVIAEGQRQGVFQAIDPLHFVITLLGATVFFVVATPRLDPSWAFDPLGREQLAAHRTQLLGVARRLLGIAPVAMRLDPDASKAVASVGEGARV